MIISSADVDDARVSIWVGGEQKLLSESEARLTWEHQRGGGAHGKSMTVTQRALHLGAALHWATLISSSR